MAKTVSTTDAVKSVIKSIPEAMSVLSESSVSLSSSLTDILPPLVENPFAFNRFLTKLYNKIILQEIINGRFENPLAPFKKQASPFGDTIERSIFNPAKAINYYDTQDNILTTAPPDMKVEYIKLNRQDKYPISLPRPVIQQAITSESNFADFMSGAMGTLYNGDSIDEFMLMKKIFSDLYTAGYITAVSKETDSRDFTKQIINYVKYFRFPSTSYVGYNMQDLGDEQPLTVWCNPSDIILVIRADVMTDVKVDVLAAAFNLSEIELNANIVEVDSFNDTNIICAICDRSFLQVRDSLYEVADFYRADDLSTKTYLHHWQYITGSLLTKATVIVDGEIESGKSENEGE